jgi:hypothetical protein
VNGLPGIQLAELTLNLFDALSAIYPKAIENA